MENSIQLVINDTLTIDGYTFEERLLFPDNEEYTGNPIANFIFRGYVGSENDILNQLKDYPIIINVKILNKENGSLIFTSDHYEKIISALNRYNTVGTQYIFEVVIGE